MQYLEGLKLKNKNLHLIGEKYIISKKRKITLTIDEIILVPTDKENASEFWNTYSKLKDGNKSIIKFIGQDVYVAVVFGKRWHVSTGELYHCPMLNLEKEFEIFNT